MAQPRGTQAHVEKALAKTANTDPSHLVTLTDNDLKLGICFYGTGAYRGVIDDFRMYSRALSPAEIETLFHLPKMGL